MAARDGRQIAVTQQQLADFVGVSRVTAGQVLAKFAAGGLIEQGYGRIAVTDAGALARFGDR
jgi:CRP-like cAMP-binding protein